MLVNNLIALNVASTGPFPSVSIFVVKNYESFISRVLLLLDHAEILEPDFLRQKLIERLKRLQDSSEGSNA